MVIWRFAETKVQHFFIKNWFSLKLVENELR